MGDSEKIIGRIQDMLNSKSNVEFYISILQRTLIETNENGSEALVSTLSGIATRKFTPRGTEFECADGITFKSLDHIHDKRNWQIHPTSAMSSEPPTVTASDMTKALENMLCVDSRSNCEQAQKRCENLFFADRAIANAVTQKDDLLYCYLNSNGARGMGRRSIEAEAVQVLLKDDVFKSRSIIKILPGSDGFSDFGFGDLEEKPFSRTIPTRAKQNICISPGAMGKIIHVLAMLLSAEPAPILSRSNPDSGLGGFSKCINLVENSTGNRIFSGSIDCSGFSRKEAMLVREGSIMHSYSDKDNHGTPLVSSSYRENHRCPPRQTPSKLELVGQVELSKLSNELGSFLVINDFRGLEQSFDRTTTSFSALVDLQFVHNGVQYRTDTTTMISTSISKLLRTIDAVSRAAEYYGDGSIYVGSAFLSNEGLISV